MSSFWKIAAISYYLGTTVIERQPQGNVITFYDPSIFEHLGAFVTGTLGVLYFYCPNQKKQSPVMIRISNKMRSPFDNAKIAW